MAAFFKVRPHVDVLRYSDRHHCHLAESACLVACSFNEGNQSHVPASAPTVGTGSPNTLNARAFVAVSLFAFCINPTASGPPLKYDGPEKRDALSRIIHVS
jgi:hypothetical protein